MASYNNRLRPPHYEAQQDGGDYGYNAPPPHDHEYDDGGMQLERSYGRGSGGRGGRRGGRGRGGYNGPPPYYEAQHDGGDYGYNHPLPWIYDDDEGVEIEPFYGRGRGRGRGGRRGGRGRGGYNGPPPYYEAQQDGGDYGYDAPPQGCGRGCGRGGRGGRGGGRGGFNRSNGPPIQTTA